MLEVENTEGAAKAVSCGSKMNSICPKAGGLNCKDQQIVLPFSYCSILSKMLIQLDFFTDCGCLEQYNTGYALYIAVELQHET